MKHVTFTREMKPQRVGDQLVLPDDVAARLEAEGSVAPGAPDWPQKPPSAATAEPPRKPKTYRTK